MGIGKILRAKGDSIELELGTGKENFKLEPLINEQFLDIQDITSDAKKDEKSQTESAMKALIKLTVYCLNNGLPENVKEEDKFTDEMIRKSSTSILMELFEKCIEINKLEKMFDFQKKSMVSGHPTLNPPSAPGSKINTLEDLKNNPRAKLG